MGYKIPLVIDKKKIINKVIRNQLSLVSDHILSLEQPRVTQLKKKYRAIRLKTIQIKHQSYK